jgi:hypothetical protein
VLSDAAWAAVMFTAFVFVEGKRALLLLRWFTFSWAGAGCVAAVVGLLQLRVLPCGPMTAIRWLRGHSDIARASSLNSQSRRRFDADHLLPLEELPVSVSWGVCKRPQILLGPLNIMFSGVGLVATAEGVRQLRDSPRRLAHDCRWLSFALTSGVLAWGMIVVLVPAVSASPSCATNWEPGDRWWCPLLIAFAGYASTFGASIGLHCLAAARRILRTNCIEAVLTLFFGLTGAYLAARQEGLGGLPWPDVERRQCVVAIFTGASVSTKAAARREAPARRLMRTISLRWPADQRGFTRAPSGRIPPSGTAPANVS